MRHCQVHDESDYFKHVSHVNGKFLPNDVILVMMFEMEEEEEESIVKKRASVEWISPPNLRNPRTFHWQNISEKNGKCSSGEIKGA